jgi:hypothetical protein
MHIVDLTRPVTPAIMSSLQAAGTITDVAVDALTQTAIIGASKLSLVNIANPAAPEVYHTIAFEGAEVEAANGYAYAARFAGHDLFSTVRSIDLVSTSAVHALTLPVREVDAMVLDADVLYLLGNHTLVVIRVDGTNMTLRGTLPIAGGKGRFSIANGIAYIPFAGDTSTGVTGGYITADLSNPDQPRIIQTSQAPAGAAVPGSMIAANGSGIGLLAGQVGVENPWAVDLMNITDPSNTYAFLTRFSLPRGGIPMALQVGSGLGVLANGSGGLVVLNYLATDVAGAPPEVGRAHEDIRWRVRFAATVRAQLAGPRATAAVLTTLPVLGIALGQLIGADPIGVLRGGPLGQVLLVIGVLLLAAGSAWSERILGSAVPR